MNHRSYSSRGRWVVEDRRQAYWPYAEQPYPPAVGGGVCGLELRTIIHFSISLSFVTC